MNIKSILYNRVILVSISIILVVSLVILISTYFLINKTFLDQQAQDQNKIGDDYAQSFETILNYTTQPFLFGVAFMERYTVYNSTLKDFLDLSGNSENDFSVVYAFYNISQSNIKNFTNIMNLNLKKNTTQILQVTLDGKIIPAGKRPYYCPIYYSSPLNNSNIPYYPGIDICSLPTFTKQLAFIENPDYFNKIIILPRRRLIPPILFQLDIIKKTKNGFVGSIVVLDNIIKYFAKPIYKIKIILKEDGNDIIAFDNCDNCSGSEVSRPVMLPNGDMAKIVIFFPYPGFRLNDGFLYVLIGVLVGDFVIISLIFWFEMQKNKYRIADKMLGYVNHEIRNPLNCIYGLIDICMDELEPIKDKIPETMSNLGTAKRACDLLTHIVNDILDLQKINQGKLVIEPQYILIKEFITNLRRILEPKLNEKPNLYLVFENRHNITSIYADYQRLLQILINFLTNSIKYTNTGGITLSIDLVENVIGDNGNGRQSFVDNLPMTIIFSVKDTGIGIEKNMFSKIFQPFEQTDIPNNLRQGGIGLGLYLCKMIITQMGGTIEFKSEKGVGSEFIIKLKTRIA